LTRADAREARALGVTGPKAWGAAVVAGVAFATAVLACAAPATAPAAPVVPASSDPRWEDAFSGTPEVLIVLFPPALRADRVYGPLLRRAIALARRQSRVVAQTRALDAMEDADEVIVGLPPSASSDDLVFVVRGVRADVDPAALVDGDGHPLWVAGPAAEIRELVGADPTAEISEANVPASLFELPGRTWVIATGETRLRARAAFARGHARARSSVPEPPADALAMLRIDGPSLVRRFPAFRPGHTLEAVGHDLTDVSLELSAGSPAAESARAEATDGGTAGSGQNPNRVIEAAFSFAAQDSAAAAEKTVRRALAVIAQTRPTELAWLPADQVAVSRPPPGARVILTTPLPARLIDALVHVGERAGAGGPATPDAGGSSEGLGESPTRAP
jgi:hypothetical protein